MTRIDGPEDLLVLARQRELNEGDERRFDIAVQSSRELELLYEAGTGFDAAAELLPGDEKRCASLIERTLAELDANAGIAPKEARAPRRRSRYGGLVARTLSTGVVLGLLLSVALASAWEYAAKRLETRHAPAADSGASSLANAPRVPANHAGALNTVVPEPLAAPALTPLTEGVIATLPSNATLTSAATPASSAKREPASRALGVNGSEVPDTAASSVAPVASLPPPSSVELFTEANALRRRGDVNGAIALYQKLCTAHPTSAEAEDARILLGNLLLEQHSAQAALEQFDGYGKGALSLEASWGKARALRSLHSPAERDVLEALLRDYPNSPYAAAARKRLQELSP